MYLIKVSKDILTNNYITDEYLRLAQIDNKIQNITEQMKLAFKSYSLYKLRFDIKSIFYKKINK